MKAKIVEIFPSIQGEGKYAGVKQVFVRFFECPMHCVWCDTPHSIGDTTREFQEYSLDQIVGKIDELRNGCHSASLTGGEPLLQKDFIKELLPFLKERGLPAYLETNGILYKELSDIIDEIDIVAMDFKLPSSTKCQPYWKEHEEFLRVALQKELFIKAVITSDTKEEDINRSMDLIASFDPNILFILQPNYLEMKNGVVKKCLKFQEDCSKRLNNVRILPQVHKFMKLR